MHDRCSFCQHIAHCVRQHRGDVAASSLMIGIRFKQSWIKYECSSFSPRPVLVLTMCILYAQCGVTSCGLALLKMTMMPGVVVVCVNAVFTHSLILAWEYVFLSHTISTTVAVRRAFLITMDSRHAPGVSHTFTSGRPARGRTWHAHVTTGGVALVPDSACKSPVFPTPDSPTRTRAIGISQAVNILKAGRTPTV